MVSSELARFQIMAKIIFVMAILACIPSCASFSQKFYSGQEEKELIASAIRKRDPSICENAPIESITLNRPRDYCYRSVAVGLCDSEVCKKITHDFNVESCMGEIAFNDAIKMNDMSRCTNAPSEKEKSQCYSDFAAKMKNPEACKVISSKDYQSHCYFRLGIILKNSELCKNSEKEGNCLGVIAAATNNMSVCSQATNESQKAECYTEFARAEGDASGCNLISNKEEQLWCYMQAAKQSLNQCDQSTDLMRKMDCYLRVAVRDVNLEVCEKILVMPLRQESLYSDTAGQKDIYRRCVAKVSFQKKSKKMIGPTTD